MSNYQATVSLNQFPATAIVTTVVTLFLAACFIAMFSIASAMSTTMAATPTGADTHVMLSEPVAPAATVATP